MYVRGLLNEPILAESSSIKSAGIWVLALMEGVQFTVRREARRRWAALGHFIDPKDRGAAYRGLVTPSTGGILSVNEVLLSTIEIAAHIQDHFSNVLIHLFRIEPTVRPALLLSSIESFRF